MPPPQGRTGSVCVYVISCIFFFLTIAGGVFLVLYITLPEPRDTILYAIVGMLLVATPWLFWLSTCLYRTFNCRDTGLEQRPPIRTASVAPVTGGTDTEMSAGEESPACTPGGARRVRFGAATVMGNQDGNGGATAGGAGAGKSEQDVDGDSHVTTASSVSNDGSSLTSHESEVPLAFSMS